MKSIIVLIMLLALSSIAQTESWVCELQTKTINGKEYTKTWDIPKGMFTHQTKDTVILYDMNTGFARVFSFGKAKVKKTCGSYGFDYDKNENYCEGYLTKETVKKVLKGHAPLKLIQDLVDTMSTESLIDMFTTKSNVIETIKFQNGYGDRLMKSGVHNSFELTITRDDAYYMEATNGVFQVSTIKLDKVAGTYEMDIAANLLEAYFTMKGTCTQVP